MIKLTVRLPHKHHPISSSILASGSAATEDERERKNPFQATAVRCVESTVHLMSVATKDKVLTIGSVTVSVLNIS